MYVYSAIPATSTNLKLSCISEKVISEKAVATASLLWIPKAFAWVCFSLEILKSKLQTYTLSLTASPVQGRSQDFSVGTHSFPSHLFTPPQKKIKVIFDSRVFYFKSRAQES